MFDMSDMLLYILIEANTMLIDECVGHPIESYQTSIRLLRSLIVDRLEASTGEVLLIEILVVIDLLQTTYISVGGGVSGGEEAVQALLNQMTSIHPIGIDSGS